jgi:segregation and condensation protein B
MSDISLVQIVEAALLAAGKPMTVPQLADLFEEHARPETTDIREALKEVAQRCEGRGYELQEVASGFRFQVRQSLAPWISRLWQERPQRYSRALLETLALIAYRQPITRGEIEEIRGVAVSSNIIKTLHEREWIRVVGHRDVPGRPAMYATTRQFLDYFNLKNLDQLPALAEIRDLETLNAELGFSEPLEKVGDDETGTPELTVVGGTDHIPQEGDPATPDTDQDAHGEDEGAVPGAENVERDGEADDAAALEALTADDLAEAAGALEAEPAEAGAQADQSESSGEDAGPDPRL